MKNLPLPPINITLPNWLHEAIANAPDMPTATAKMQWIIELSKLNIKHNTGGPFACAIFDNHDQVIAAGVNLVTSLHNPVLHAETTAIMMAHARCNTYYFDTQQYHLFTSTEPCVMCLGACLWSGVKSVTCAARDEDAAAIGFDEGPKPNDWQAALRTRGITVQTDLCRQGAIEVLQTYISQGGLIYGSQMNQ